MTLIDRVLRGQGGLAPIAAVVAIGGALTQVFADEAPVGRVRGRTVVSETGRPLAGVEIALSPIRAEGDADAPVRSATTDANGRFLLTQVTAGSYQISASARAHAEKDVYLSVDEGGTSDTTLTLTRSQPALSMAQHQRVFATAEQVDLPVQGYVDGGKPHGADNLHVRVYRTRLSDVIRNAGAGGTDQSDAARTSPLAWLGIQPGMQRDDADTHPLPASLVRPRGDHAPQLMVDREQRITEDDREGYFHQPLKFGTLRPGLYLVEIDHTKASACTWMLVTDTALVVKHAGGQLLAYAVDMTRGTPLPGATVRAYRSSVQVAQAVTDPRGIAELHAPPGPREDGEGGGDQPLMAIAERGEDEAIVERSGYYQAEGAGAYTVAAYTDRPVYRPGNHIQYKGIARRNIDPGARYALPAGLTVDVSAQDEQGDRVYHAQVVTNAMGAFHGGFDLSPEAPSGAYTLLMKIGSEQHTHDIMVASYKKPEYEVTVSPGKETYLPGESVEMIVSARYYFGTPVAGAELKWNVDRQPDWSSAYLDEETDGDDEGASPDPFYRSDDRRYLGQADTEGTVRLDENGKAIVRFPAQPPEGDDAPPQETYTLSASVTDAAGREVDATGTANVASGAYRLYVQPDGYVGDPGKPHTVVLVLRDLQGEPAPNVRVDLAAGFPERGEDDEKVTLRSATRQTVTTGPDGRAIATVVPPRAGELKLDASAVDPGGRRVEAHGEIWVSGDSGGYLHTEYADLSVLTDRRRYEPGQTARVMVNAAHTGQTVLLTLEGQRVYRSVLVPMTARSVVTYVRVLPEYGPNVALSACYVKDKHFATSEAQLRVSLRQREVQVTVTADRSAQPTGDTEQEARAGRQEAGSSKPGRAITHHASRNTHHVASGDDEAPLPRYAPRDTVRYTVQTTDSRGRPVPAEFSFGVVDESIYALREDDPKLLRDAFYPRRQNNVSTDYSFAVEMMGDADKTEPNIEARKEFPDTDYWQPDLTTDANGRATVVVPLKDNLTTWRATAVAQTADSAFGRAVCKVLASKSFFVRVETPRFLTARDQAQILALVHNDTDRSQTAFVHLRADGVTVDGAQQRSVEVPAHGVGQVAWNATALDADTARIDVSAWTPREPSQRAATGFPSQYTDRMVASFPIRPHGREEVQTFSGELTAGQTPETFRLDPTAVTRATRVTVRVTPSISGSLVGALDYLVGYPYGCTEQTMSRFLPDVLVHRLVRQSRLRLDAGRTADLPKMVRDSLVRLRRFQHQSGAWGWWEYDQDDAWMTGYVLYGLATAKAEGYSLPGDMLEKGLKGATDLLGKDIDPGDKAFLLYAMALAGSEPERTTAGIVRRHLPMARLSPAALAYVTLLDALLRQDPKPGYDALMARAHSEEGRLYWQPAENDYHGWDARMSTAAALRATLALDPHGANVNSILRWLMSKRTGAYWEDTRDTSWVLGALCDYLAAQPQSVTPTGVVTVALNGHAVAALPLTPQTAEGPDLIVRVPAALVQPGKNDVTIARTGGDSTVFYALEVRQTLSTEDMPAWSASQLGVKREILRRVPHRIGHGADATWTLQTEPTNNRLHVGDPVVVRLTVDAPQDLSYVLVEDPFPAGCEVTERGTAGEAPGDWSFWWSSVDIRDDRIAFFMRDLKKGKHVIEYNLRAQTPGSFHTLPTMLQAMYVPEIRAYSAETRVEVSP